MMRRTKRFAATTAAVAIFALTLIPFAGHTLASTPASTPASTLATPGVTDSQILIGTSLPESGPAGAYGVIAGGAQAYFSYVNAHGGVYGRKLKLITLDDGYDPARTVANVRNLVLNKNVFALFSVLGTANNLAVLPFITQQGVPLVYPASGSSLMAHPFHKYLFPTQVTYTVEGKVLTDYAVRTLHARRLGVFYQNDDFGLEGLNAVKSQASKDGASVADAESYQVTDADLSAQALRLQRAGVDAIVIFAIPSPAAIFIGTARKVGVQAALLSSSIASDPAVLKSLGAAGEGVYFDDYGPLPTANEPLTAFYRMVISRYGDPVGTPLGTFTLAGVDNAELLVEGLRRAGRNLTRPGLIKALETLRNYVGPVDKVTPYDGKITYSARSHAGLQGAYVLRVHNETLIPVSGFEYP